MVRPGVTGLLVPTGNVALLRSAIEQLLDDPESRAAMGRNARRIAVAEYALEVQARRYLELYQGLVERAGASYTK
jgi:glycosyltransferase involved in cell wall biosynthesis